MKNEDFNLIIKERINKVQDLLIKKSEEYVRGNDRFHNFTVGANLTGETKEKVLWGFLIKHIVSVQDIINDINNTKKIPRKEIVSEKIGDCLTYLLILEALIEERRNNNE